MEYIFEHIFDIGTLLLLLAIHHELREIKETVAHGTEVVCDSIPKG